MKLSGNVFSFNHIQIKLLHIPLSLCKMTAPEPRLEMDLVVDIVMRVARVEVEELVLSRTRSSEDLTGSEDKDRDGLFK